MEQHRLSQRMAADLVLAKHKCMLLPGPEAQQMAEAVIRINPTTFSYQA